MRPVPMTDFVKHARLMLSGEFDDILGGTVSDSGIYVLLLHVAADRRIRVGRLGVVPFRKGYYAYVGSGKRGLNKRIERHLRRDKRVRWHIDYLLEFSEVVEVMAVETKKDLECKIAAELSKRFQPIKRFGSSDCKCPSHLFYSPSSGGLKKAVARSLGGSRPFSV